MKDKLKRILVFILCTVIINASTLPWYTVWAIETEPSIELQVIGGALKIRSSLEDKVSPLYYKIDEYDKWTKYANLIEDIKIGKHKIQLRYNDTIIEKEFEIEPPETTITVEDGVVKVVTGANGHDYGSDTNRYNSKLYRYSIDGINFNNIDDMNLVVGYYSSCFEGKIRLQPGEYTLIIKWNDVIVKEENIIVDKMKLNFDISNKYNMVSITPNIELEEPFDYQIDNEEEWHEYTENFWLESGNHNIKIRYKDEVVKEENISIDNIRYSVSGNRIIIYDCNIEVDEQGNRTGKYEKPFEGVAFQVNGGDWTEFREDSYYKTPYGIMDYGNPAMIIYLPITGENIVKYKYKDNEDEYTLYQGNIDITSIYGGLRYEAEDKININAFINGGKVYTDIYYLIDGSEEKLYTDSIFLTEGNHNIVARIYGQEIINEDINVEILIKAKRNKGIVSIYTNSGNSIKYSIDGKNFYEYKDSIKINRNISKIYVKIGDNDVKECNIIESEDEYTELMDIELSDSEYYSEKLIKYFYQTEYEMYTFGNSGLSTGYDSLPFSEDINNLKVLNNISIKEINYYYDYINYCRLPILLVLDTFGNVWKLDMMHEKLELIDSEKNFKHISGGYAIIESGEIFEFKSNSNEYVSNNVSVQLEGNNIKKMIYPYVLTTDGIVYKVDWSAKKVTECKRDVIDIGASSVDGKIYFLTEDKVIVNNESEINISIDSPKQINNQGGILAENGNYYKLEENNYILYKTNVSKMANYFYKDTNGKLYYFDSDEEIDMEKMKINITKDYSYLNSNQVKINVEFPDDTYKVIADDNSEYTSSFTYTVYNNGIYKFKFLK